MLTISITGEKCPFCPNEQLAARVVTIREDFFTDTPGAHLRTEPAMMLGNSSEIGTYAQWHCDDFVQHNNCMLTVVCPDCQAEITYSLGIVSKCVRKGCDIDHLENENCLTADTFLKWLTLQKDRNDIVGDFAREFAETKKHEKKDDCLPKAPANTNDYIAMLRYVEQWRNGWPDGFKMAWHEFLLLRAG